MLEPSRRRDTTVVARLSSDAATVQKIADALAGSPAAEEIAVAAFEDASGRWSLAIYFRQHPDETALRALIASAAGTAAAQALGFETLAPTDWVDKSREGLAPVEAGRFVVHGAHARKRARINRIAVEIDAGLAFGTGHHGTTRGCLLALDRIIKERRHRQTKSSFRSSPRKRRRRPSRRGLPRARPLPADLRQHPARTAARARDADCAACCAARSRRAVGPAHRRGRCCARQLSRARPRARAPHQPRRLGDACSDA